MPPVKRLFLALSLLLLLMPAWISRPGVLVGPGWQVVIVSQPKSCWDCVTPRMGEATLFREAHGQTALLAHDYLSGALWHGLRQGDVLYLDWQEYVVTETFAWYPPGAPGWREADVYWYVYNRPGALTLQTCLGAGYWFVIAEHIEER